MLVGSGYFGGACAAWRPAALRQLGFDTRMQTEDIDLSIRALSQVRVHPNPNPNPNPNLNPYPQPWL